jgi:hypothetical protein
MILLAIIFRNGLRTSEFLFPYSGQVIYNTPYHKMQLNPQATSCKNDIAEWLMKCKTSFEMKMYNHNFTLLQLHK